MALATGSTSALLIELSVVSIAQVTFAAADIALELFAHFRLMKIFTQGFSGVPFGVPGESYVPPFAYYTGCTTAIKTNRASVLFHDTGTVIPTLSRDTLVALDTVFWNWYFPSIAQVSSTVMDLALCDMR